jgi:hypothetical protein
MIYVKTSPVKHVNFVSYVSSGRSFTATDNEVLTEVEYQMRGSERYIRIEFIDKNGKIAWSNPVVYNT